MTKTRILVADDHAMIRATLVRTLQLETDFEIVGEAADGDEAVSLTEEVRPDVVLMDYRMPKRDGAEAAKLITQSLPDVAVVGLSSYGGPVPERMAKAGAVAFLSKTDGLGDLVETIQNAAGDKDGGQAS